MAFKRGPSEDESTADEFGEEVDSTVLLARQIGSFEITDRRSGFSFIARAYDAKADREVLIKEIRIRDRFDGQKKEIFTRLAKTITRIVHPNVVTTFGAIEGVDRPLLVMEFVEGQTLNCVIRHSDAATGVNVLTWALEIARGLHSIHHAGLIHQDLKPSNVLIGSQTSIAKIIDFDCAKISGETLTLHGSDVAGTPQYMSPEQVVRGSVDLRSDLFSLGSLFYELCSGRNPFKADNAWASMRKVADCDPIPIGACNSTVPGWFADIVGKLLKKDPADRIQSASEVAVRISDRIGSEDISSFKIASG